jgi:pimeloyl-ACP methyl ester carboxylesterase
MLALCSISSTSSLIHSWFNPLERWRLPRADTPAAPKQVLAYIPGLDGGNGSPFVQFPGLGDLFDVRVQDVSFAPTASEASFEAVVDDVAAYLRELQLDSRGSVVMGESYGGVIAAGVALRHADLVSGLILVNPATSVSVMPALQQDIETMRFGNVPEALYALVLFAKVGRKTFDGAFLATAVKDILIEKKMEKLRQTDPGLAGYYDAALEDFVGQLTAAKEARFWRGRLAQLVAGCEYVEPRLAQIAQPTLVVAGTADALLDSAPEAARLARILPRCETHLVEGAGHAGTLDQRVDLPSVVSAWASRSGLGGRRESDECQGYRR